MDVVALMVHALLCTIALLAHQLLVAAVSTVDKLRAQPLVSEAYIAQQNEACDMTRLCSYDEMNVAAICGSDGRTYNSECEIKRAACHGNPVVKQMDGACPENSKCRLERRFQQDIARRKNSSVIFVPECDDTDGSYSIVQCHQSTGYCWCVTKTGRPLPGTSVRNKRPNCLPYGKVGRRSSHTSKGTESEGCSTLDRSTFNSNLLKIFQSEYERDPKNRLKANGRGTSLSAGEKGMNAIIWKFDQLDKNKNGQLSRRELRGQKRLIKKLIQPLACARRFNKYCDLDKNNRIDRREWVTCLSVDINTVSYRLFSSLNSKSPFVELRSADDAAVSSVATVDEQEASPGDLRSVSEWASSPTGSSGFFLKEKPTDVPVAVEEETTDCRSQRGKTMIAHEQNPEGGVYVPTCTGPNDVLFDQIQCHKPTNYCWCVIPATGEPIAGTSVQYTTPDCSTPVRSMGEIKGCKPKKQDKFFKRFFSTIETEMIMVTGDQASESDIMSKREKIVRWKFAQLDVNKNNRLERREWKAYRKEMKQWNKVRRCGRNFIRFCDVDKNKKITLAEWLECTIEADAPSPPAVPSPESIRNPFLDILKFD